MTVKTQRPISISNHCSCLVDENELIKAILWYSSKPVISVKNVYLSGKYPAVSIHDEKVHVHRLLVSYWMGRKLLKTEYVHHKDENKLNDLRMNLQLLFPSKHQSLHNKGKSLTTEHKRKIGIANSRRRGMKFKKHVNIPLDIMANLKSQGMTINGISKFFGVNWSTIKSRFHENPELLEDKQ